MEGDILSSEIVSKNIGIDFGTTNTVIYSRDKNGKLQKIGGKSTRTAVYFVSKNECVIGRDAIRCAKNNNTPQALMLNFKPDICDKREIVAENGDRFKLKCKAIAKIFLNQLLNEKVEKRLLKLFGNGEMTDHDKTIITVPAKFSPDQKKYIKSAAQDAYFSNVGLVFEPTAAAVASLGTDIKDDIVAVYDFGGGTFDISVIERDLQGHFKQIAEDGDRNLGGNTVTDMVIEKFLLPILEENGVEFSMDVDDMDFDDDDVAMTEEEYYYNVIALREVGNEIKEAFSEEVEYKDKFIILQNGEPVTYDVSITLEEFENAILPLIQNTIDITQRVIDSVYSQKKYVHKIVMAGGSSKILLAQKLLIEQFENDGIEIILSDEPFDLIAKGALLIAEQQKLFIVEEKTTQQFGVGERTNSGLTRFYPLISENVVLPTKGNKIYDVTKEMLKTGELEIPCYEKDVKNYPHAQVTRDKGVSYINTYKISIDNKLQPSCIDIQFEIDTDGTLQLSAKLLDSKGSLLKTIQENVASDDVI
jgi:molecular chaperone DnaK